MTRGLLYRLLSLGLPVALLLSCSTGDNAVSGGGIGGTGVTVGPITEFGSIVVNDVRVDISDAIVNLEGMPGDLNDPHFGLKLGMVVVVRGDFSADGLTGVATRVEYEDSLEGPIESVDVSGNHMTVLRHTVIVNAATVFDGFSSLSDLAPGNMVEVSGLVDAGGNIVAARIERKGLTFDDVGELEIKGTISNLNTGAMTFDIGSLAVDYGAIPAELEQVPSGGLADGLFVEVKSEQPPSGGTILASEVEVKTPFADSLGEEGDYALIEGFVTEFIALDQPFRVNGFPVRVTASTQYEGGSPGQIADGVLVEVEGLLADDGVLVAVEVEFEADELE